MFRKIAIAMERSLQWLPLIAVAAVLVLVLFSWLGNVNGLGLVSLLSDEGIRWTFSHLVENFSNSPVLLLMLSTVALGGVGESGLFNVGSKGLSLKQGRALLITLFVAALMATGLLMFVFMPGSVLLSATGSMVDSPLSKGLPAFVVVCVIVLSVVYGLLSGRYLSLSDIVASHTGLTRYCAPFFFHAFVAAQLVALLKYSNFFSLTGNEETWLLWLDILLYYLPFLLYVAAGLAKPEKQ